MPFLPLYIAELGTTDVGEIAMWTGLILGATPTVTAVLRPGDALYLPRGWLHAARAQGAVSIHLTLGVHNWTRHGLAEQLARAALEELRDDPAMRTSLRAPSERKRSV